MNFSYSYNIDQDKFFIENQEICFSENPYLPIDYKISLEKTHAKNLFVGKITCSYKLKVKRIPRKKKKEMKKRKITKC